MTERFRTVRRTGLIILLTAGVILSAGYAFMHAKFPQLYADTSVYSIKYEKPTGWIEEQPGPFTLFVFKHPKGKGTIRASVNEIQSHVNPTPELDTNGIAEHYIMLTGENMPEWKAQRLDDIQTQTEKFSLIKRTKDGRTVFTAFCAKGNTTIVVSLTAGGKGLVDVDDLLPEYRKVISSFKLTPKYVEIDD